MEMKMNECYIPLIKDTSRYVVMYGGAGSGKSYGCVQLLMTRILTEPQNRFLVLRKVATSIKPSVWNLFLELIGNLELTEDFKININDLKLTHIPSGSEILFMGLEDVERLKSIQGISSVWIEEATEITREDLKQINYRIRGIQLKNKKVIYLTFNPINENHWLKAHFFDREVKNCTILKTTYLDNNFIDEDYKLEMQDKSDNDENSYRIYTLGEWGQESSENNFYKDFRFSRHVEATTYNPELPLHISWDFNINPSCSLLIWQTLGNKLYCIDEIQLAYPKNYTKDICREFAHRYRDHTAGLFIYGDPNGKKGDTRSESGFNDYSIIQKELRQFNPSMRIAMKAPPVHMRGMFINSAFDGEFQDCFIIIDPKCKGFIADLQYLKQQADGTKLKQMTKKDGIAFEKYGHFSDAFDYFICQYLNSLFLKFQRGGDKPIKAAFGRNKFNTKLKW